MEKTCGNCGNAIPIPIEGEDGTMNYDMISVCPCDWSIDLIRREPSFDAHTPDRESCEEWVEQKEKSLEQRYQQLAKVAREMFDWCDGVVNRFYTIVPERVDGFRKKLEELVVEV